MTEVQKAILRTIVYADIFEYPLSEKEIYRFLISNFQFSRHAVGQAISNFQKNLENLNSKIQKKNNLYFLKGREEIVEIRQKREKESEKKIKITQRIANLLKFIPTIKLVGITGALAMNNANKDDDIDFLIITAKDRLWITRGLVVVLLRILGIYRRPNKIKDKICPNMFLDESHLLIPKQEQDLFIAHEVCQLKPLWNKNQMYNQFIKQNLWVKKYLTNWKPLPVGCN